MLKPNAFALLFILLLTSCSLNPFSSKEDEIDTSAEVITEIDSQLEDKTGVTESTTEPAIKATTSSSNTITKTEAQSSASSTPSSESTTSSSSSTSTKSNTNTSTSTSTTTSSGDSSTSTESTETDEAEPVTKTFNISAKKWEFSPSTITVNKGDTVVINITSTDVSHGFFIPDFNVNTSISAGKTSSVSFVASKTGTFSFSCSVFCGSGHGSMTGVLIVK